MKKILAMFVLILSISSLAVKAQPGFSVSIHGGYSWAIGYAGADIQYGRFALGGGWVPTKMPMSETRVNSYSASLTYYQPVPVLKGLSGYLSLGGSTKGYRMEDSWGGEAALPIAICTVGARYDLGRFWLRAGGGYGWRKEMDEFTFEACLGYKLFKN